MSNGDVSIPLIVYAATQDDWSRKPRPGMFNMYVTEHETFKVKESLYVGDAAGRKGDFSDSDYKFALNAGLPFYTTVWQIDSDERGRDSRHRRHCLTNVVCNEVVLW